MQNKDQKKNKNCNIGSSSNNKNIEDHFLINKLIQKNKKTITNNNSNSNILRTNTQDSKTNANNNNQNKLIKNSTMADNDKQNNIGKEKEKKNKSIYLPPNFHDKIGSEKKQGKAGGTTKKKTPIKLEAPDKKNKNKYGRKISAVNENKKNPFSKSRNNNDLNDKRKKSDYVNNKNKNTKKEIINEKQKIENSLSTQKLLEFLISLSPIDTSKCDELISNNMNKIIELENKIKEISKITEKEIKEISNDENNKDKITTKQNLEIINRESKMRKEIYILFFNFITDLLEQINKLSNHIANQELNDFNIKDNSSSCNDNLFLNSNNGSDMSNNSLFVSNIEEEFCEKLINITRSFISSDIDLNDIRSNFENIDNQSERINLSKWNKIENGEIFKGEEKKIIDYNDNEVSKNNNKKLLMVHPNEILNKIQNEEKKNKKVIHHYSNSLKVNSNLEKLEGKINNDDDNINSDIIGNIGNLEKIKNCTIF